MSRMSVKQAAIVLGITPRAVRLRIEEKRIPATMMDGKWFVELEDSFPPSREGRQEFPPIESAYIASDIPDEEVFSSIPPSQEGRQEVAVPAQFQLVMDQWVNPLVGQIRQQAEEIGELRAKLQESERQRLALVEVIEDETYPQGVNVEESRGIWKIIRRWLTGEQGRETTLNVAD